MTNQQTFADITPMTTPEKRSNLVKPISRGALQKNSAAAALTKTHVLTPAEIRQVLAALPEDMEWTQIRAKLFAQLHRKVRSRGERHHRAKLTNADIANILALRRGGMSYGEIERKFEGITSKSNIAAICKGRSRQLPTPEELAGYA